MCAATDVDTKLDDLLRDPLIRLVMRSDGVTKREMVVLVRDVRRALAVRETAIGRLGSHRLSA